MIYRVSILTTPASTLFVRADTRAAARAAATARLISIDRATEDDLLDLKRGDVIDAALVPTPDDDQQPLPLVAATTADGVPLPDAVDAAAHNLTRED
jgi:hypothetical protein